MISKLVFAAALTLAAPALAQPTGETRTQAAAEATAADKAAEAPAETTAPAAAKAPAPAAPAPPAAATGQQPQTAEELSDRVPELPRAGLRVRAATGPVGDVAAVRGGRVVLRLQADGKPAMKLIDAARLEIRGDEAVTDLTLRELQALPDAR